MLAAVPCQFARADVVFLVDNSQTICGSDTSCSNWQSILTFINDIIRQLNVGQNNTRIGFVLYSDSFTPIHEFYLNDEYDRTRLMNAVSGVVFVSGATVGDHFAFHFCDICSAHSCSDAEALIMSCPLRFVLLLP